MLAPALALLGLRAMADAVTASTVLLDGSALFRRHAGAGEQGG